MRECDLYEVIVVPQEEEVRREMDLRFFTFAARPDKALAKVKDHLTDRNHVALGNCDFVVQSRPFLE